MRHGSGLGGVDVTTGVAVCAARSQSPNREVAVPEKNLLREPLRAFKPYVAGKPIEEVRRELGLTRRIAKLASNENPLGT